MGDSQKIGEKKMRKKKEGDEHELTALLKLDSQAELVSKIKMGGILNQLIKTYSYRSELEWADE